MRRTRVRSRMSPELIHPNRDLPPRKATTPRQRRGQEPTMDPCTPPAVRLARRYVGIICEENLALESSTASEDSIGIVADGQRQQFEDMTLYREARGHSRTPRKTPEPKPNHASGVSNSWHQSADVLGADQSVPRHRGNDAMKVTKGRQEGQDRQVNPRIMSPANHVPPRLSPREATRRDSRNTSQVVEGLPAQRWKKEGELAMATEMQRVGSIIEEMCHGVHQVLPGLSERTKTGTSGTLHCPSLSASLRRTNAPITGTRPKTRTSDPANVPSERKQAMAVPEGIEEQLERRKDALRATLTRSAGDEDGDSTWNLDSWLNRWKSLTRKRGYNEGIAILFLLELIQGSRIKELKSRVQRESQSIKDLLAMITGLELFQEKEQELRLFLWKDLDREDPSPLRKTEMGKKAPEGSACAGGGKRERGTSQPADAPRFLVTPKKQRRPHQLSPSAIYEGLMILMVRAGTEMRGKLGEASPELSLKAAAMNLQQQESRRDSPIRD